MGSRIALNLGCGPRILPGYVNVDITDRGQEVVSDIRELPFDDGYADEVMAIHVVEHFYPWEVPALLAEWKRVLKVGGEIVLECPDISKAAQFFLNGHGSPQLHMWVWWGDPAHKDPYMMHKWGYTPQTLAEELSNAGFHSLSRRPAQFKLKDVRDFRIVGVR